MGKFIAIYTDQKNINFIPYPSMLEKVTYTKLSENK